MAINCAMKKTTLIITAMLFTAVVSAQISVSGIIKDNKGKVIAGSSITLKDTYDGATTDSTGRFAFKTLESGEQVLLITSIGYTTIEQAITLAEKPVVVNFVLKEKLDELKAVMVTAGTFEASDKKRAATVLSTMDVLTTGGANADIVATAKTLPGAQQVGESEGLFVRGGTGTETKQFIDGTVVNNPFFTSVPDIAQRGRFNPNLFKGTIFSTGGYSAIYGQALSSALILESIDLPDQSEINVSLSPLFAGVGTQQLSKNKNSSWGASYNHTNLFAYFKLVKQRVDYFKMPAFHDGDFNFRVKTRRGGIIKYYTSLGINRLGLRRPDIDSQVIKNAFGLENKNWYQNLSYKENLGKGWKSNMGLSYSTNKDDISNELQDQDNLPKTFPGQQWLNDKNFRLNNRQDLFQVRAVLEKRFGGISAIRFGSEYWYAYNKNIYNGITSVLQDHYNAFFAETDIYFTNNIAAKIGSRIEYSSIINSINVAPRISLAHRTGKDAQVSLAYGIYYQKPENMQLFQSTQLDYTKATHYIANYQKINKSYTFRIEAFYKKYNHLVKTAPMLHNGGNGYAKGVELFWRDKKSVRNLDYWISYSYLDTERDFLNYPTRLQPPFAAKHTGSLVTKRWVTKISTGFNFTYTYASGRPYYNIRYSVNDAKYIMKDQGKTNSYHNLGFSANYVTRIKSSYAVFVASMTNVLGNNQVYGYNYSYNGMIKEAIVPPARRFFFIGVFLSWGVDRTQDAINRNL